MKFVDLVGNYATIVRWSCGTSLETNFLAQATQSSNDLGHSSTRTLFTFSKVSTGSAPCNFIVFSKKSDSVMYCNADNGACVKVPSNASLAHCKVCSIWFGKFFRVQMGIDFSGGSYNEERKN